MSSTHPTGLRREQPIEKAARLVRERRVRVLPDAQVYLVAGDSDLYRVIASAEGVHCPCPASTPLCAHVLAVAHVRGLTHDASPPEFSVRAGVLS